MPPTDLWAEIQAYDRREMMKWERERMTWFYIHQHSMVDRKHSSPTSLHPFPWEGKTEVKMVDDPKEKFISHFTKILGSREKALEHIETLSKQNKENARGNNQHTNNG